SSYSPPTSSIGTIYYYCIVSATGSGCGSATSTVASVVVQPPLSITSQPTATQSICIGGATSSIAVTVSGGSSSYNYQWYSNTVNSNSGGTLISGAASDSYVPPASATGTTYYYCIVSNSVSGIGCNDVTSTTAEVIVVSDPQIILQPTNPSAICVGGVFTLSTNASNGISPLSYQWQYFDGSSWSNVINNTPSGSVYTGGTSTSLNCSSISAAGSYQYRCQITSPGLGCDAIFTNTVTVDVLADPTVTVQPIAGPSICLGGTQVLSLTATGGTPSLTYNWQSNNSGTWVNVANGTPTGAVYTGATTNSLTIAGISVVGSTQYRCQVLATGNGCGTATSTTSTLNVVAAPSISTQPVITQTVCVGGTPTNLQAIASGGTPSLQYQWYSNSANSYTGATLVSGATSA
ncbi:MAG: hypothetical protein ACK46O_09005, partial [Flavobacteriia bacterium]